VRLDRLAALLAVDRKRVGAPDASVRVVREDQRAVGRARDQDPDRQPLEDGLDAALGLAGVVVEVRPRERIGALLRDRQDEGPLLRQEAVRPRIAEAEDAEDAIVPHQRQDAVRAEAPAPRGHRRDQRLVQLHVALGLVPEWSPISGHAGDR
jgi:hypothetical protein